jgi:hypothetical protein
VSVPEAVPVEPGERAAGLYGTLREVPTFSDVFATQVASALARQLALADLIGDRDWRVDVPGGVAAFGADLRFPIQLLGTEGYGDGSWQWAWANKESEIPPVLLHLCGWVREYGRQNGIAELTEASLPLQRVDGHRLALLAAGLTGRAYYRGPYDGGALFFHLENLPEQVLAPVAPERALTVIGQVIQSFEVDHRSMAQAFLRQQGWQLEATPALIVGRHPGGSEARIEFDPQGRISQLSGQLRAS